MGQERGTQRLTSKYTFYVSEIPAFSPLPHGNRSPQLEKREPEDVAYFLSCSERDCSTKHSVLSLYLYHQGSAKYAGVSKLD